MLHCGPLTYCSCFLILLQWRALLHNDDRGIKSRDLEPNVGIRLCPDLPERPGAARLAGDLPKKK